MSFAERVKVWNGWYDGLPEDWRFQFVVWPLIAIGAINMLLTVVAGFPFALLLVLSIIAVAVIRVPCVLGWVTAPEVDASDAKFQIEGAGWVVDLNRRYEAMPESRRFWVYPAVLLIGGALNMMLTIAYGFPFGLLFLLVLLALVAVRAPYAAGWLRTAEAPAAGLTHPYIAEVEQNHMTAIAAQPRPSEPAIAPEHGHDAQNPEDKADRLD